MKTRIFFGGVIVLVLVSAALWMSSGPPDAGSPAYRQTQVRIGGVTLNADIADTAVVRARGLSGRTSLAQNEAMLFIFQEDGAHSFWMKDMLFPIDMIWLSADKRVVHIAKNAMPESYPTSFSPNAPSRYVIEVPAGFADRHAVSTGTVATWE